MFPPGGRNEAGAGIHHRHGCKRTRPRRALSSVAAPHPRNFSVAEETVSAIGANTSALDGVLCHGIEAEALTSAWAAVSWVCGAALGRASFPQLAAVARPCATCTADPRHDGLCDFEVHRFWCFCSPSCAAVVPAQAGTQCLASHVGAEQRLWVPAFAGTTANRNPGPQGAESAANRLCCGSGQGWPRQRVRTSMCARAATTRPGRT